MEKSNENEILRVRQKIGLSRIQMGKWLNRSWQSVQRYEKHPELMPVEILYNVRRLERFYDGLKTGELE